MYDAATAKRSVASNQKISLVYFTVILISEALIIVVEWSAYAEFVGSFMVAGIKTAFAA